MMHLIKNALEKEKRIKIIKKSKKLNTNNLIHQLNNPPKKRQNKKFNQKPVDIFINRMYNISEDKEREIFDQCKRKRKEVNIMKKFYGSLSARLEEGKNYNQDNLIHEGDDITMYYWSDQKCYYIVKVNNQKDILVKQYSVVADQEKARGMGHQDWLYFKTEAEANKYMNKHLSKEYIEKYGLRNENVKDPEPQNWVFRNNQWKSKTGYTLEKIENICSKNHWSLQVYLDCYFTPTEQKKLAEGKEVYKYKKLDGKISFGVRDYYYDWSF